MHTDCAVLANTTQTDSNEKKKNTQLVRVLIDLKHALHERGIGGSTDANEERVAIVDQIDAVAREMLLRRRRRGSRIGRRGQQLLKREEETEAEAEGEEIHLVVETHVYDKKFWQPRENMIAETRPEKTFVVLYCVHENGEDAC
jgi:hypothetical protein